MKRTPLILLTVLIILLVILFSLLSCEQSRSETEAPSEETPKSDETATGTETDTTNEESTESFDIEVFSTPFIEANIQFSCEIIRNPDLKTSEALMKQRLAQIYKEKGFPTHDDNQMILILQKYEKDQDTTDTIREGTAECLAE
jgi:hypothetical protein